MKNSSGEINSLGLLRGQCAAFTGYRPAKFALSFPGADAEYTIRMLLRPVLKDLYDSGIRIFLTGMAEGFDLWAALEVLKMREEGICAEASVAAVAPYQGQAQRYSAPFSDAYRYVLGEAVRSVIISEVYFPECFHRRNDFLVDNASVLVCYYDGQRGGTSYTINRAKRMGVPVINLYAPALM